MSDNLERTSARGREEKASGDHTLVHMYFVSVSEDYCQITKGRADPKAFKSLAGS